MRDRIWFVGAVLLLACSADAQGVREISPDALLARRGAPDAPVVVDVRSAEEYAGGHVPGALNVPVDELPSRLPELEAQRDADVVLYCESGRRAGRAANLLQAAGFEHVLHLEGDMSGWRSAGRSIERP